jgi:hypothetical protein
MPVRTTMVHRVGWLVSAEIGEGSNGTRSPGSSPEPNRRCRGNSVWPHHAQDRPERPVPLREREAIQEMLLGERIRPTLQRTGACLWQTPVLVTEKVRCLNRR